VEHDFVVVLPASSVRRKVTVALLIAASVTVLRILTRTEAS
jgi:hypothetical protein